MRCIEGGLLYYSSRLLLRYCPGVMPVLRLKSTMEYAKELLTKGNKSVVEVSNLLDYSAPNNFSRAFKIKYGISPQTYKKQVK